LTDTLTAVTFVFACICVKVWHTSMTIWALIIALLIGNVLSSAVWFRNSSYSVAFLYVVPIGQFD
jgi:RsiW-degrading membrane proteinase PrsW (M82 family)